VSHGGFVVGFLSVPQHAVPSLVSLRLAHVAAAAAAKNSRQSSAPKSPSIACKRQINTKFLVCRPTAVAMYSS